MEKKNMKIRKNLEFFEINSRGPSQVKFKVQYNIHNTDGFSHFSA